MKLGTNLILVRLAAVILGDLPSFAQKRSLPDLPAPIELC